MFIQHLVRFDKYKVITKSIYPLVLGSDDPFCDLEIYDGEDPDWTEKLTIWVFLLF